MRAEGRSIGAFWVEVGVDVGGIGATVGSVGSFRGGLPRLASGVGVEGQPKRAAVAILTDVVVEELSKYLFERKGQSECFVVCLGYVSSSSPPFTPRQKTHRSRSSAGIRGSVITRVALAKASTNPASSAKPPRRSLSAVLTSNTA